MFRVLWAFALLAFAAPTFAQGGQVLYPGLTGTALRDAVRADYAPSQVLGYGPARDAMFAWEQNEYGRLRGVYTGMEIVLNPSADPSSDAFSKGINTEHAVPRSLGSTGDAESDMHHLFPTRVEANSARGNNPFAEIPDAQTSEWFRGTTSQSSIPTTAIDEWSESTSSAFEPREDHAGNAARAVFYHAAIYTTMPASFFEAQLSDLLRWTYEDPADAAEAARSAWVATQQGTENPFVLDSTLARRIWGDPSDPPPPPPPSPSEAEVWVNEIHYDDNGGDEGEGIEVAGTAGADLTGWSLVLYNGSVATQYSTIALSGTLADQQGGFGTAWFLAPGLQNGSPDGLALVDPEGDVVQFLSYEGSFTASGGPADGMTSTDIGVEEPGNTPEGHSLQLIGTGSSYADFAWTAPMAGTPGQPNTGQTFEGAPPPPPAEAAWINEIHYDNDGSDRREGIEIAGTAGLDLANWQIITYERGTGVHRTLPLTGVIPDEGAGFGAVWFKIKRLRNNKYGLALLDAQGTLVEFISYEGGLDGVGGPADGLRSVDVGVFEGPGTTKKQSIQRLGGAGSDAIWTGPATQSRGFLNEGQVLGGSLVASAPVDPARLDAEVEGVARIAPNPIRQRAVLTLPTPGETVRVELFDALGRRVALLLDGPAPDRLAVDASDLAPGIYVVRIASASAASALRVTVAR
ncbi:MAG: endonuclease [Bacteroidota bacterium]